MADKQQLSAINHESGPALILAGPGSGKTYVLTHHISYLINSLGVSPANILVITFTKEAAGNMKQRFSSLSKYADDVLFGTFHSVFYKFLRMFYGNRYRIIGSKEALKYVESIVTGRAKAEEILSLISKYKSCYPNEELGAFNASYEGFSDIYRAYNSLLGDRDELDYDDILIKCYELIRDNPAFRLKLSARFKYILIDEFQDISRIQYEIIRKITEDTSHIFAVGDEDQSIYSFRGAAKDMMKIFLKDYKNAAVITLNTNYRSTRQIVEKANNLILHNYGRLRSDIQNCVSDSDDSFKLNIFDKAEDYISILAEDIRHMHERGLSCGVLLRTNGEVQKFDGLLGKRKHTKEIDIKRLIISVYRDYLSYDLYGDRASFLSLLNVPERYLETSLFTEFPVNFDRLINNTKNMKRRNELSMLSSKMDMLKKCTPGAFCVYLWNVCGIKKYIYDLFPEGKDISDNVIKELLDISAMAKNKEAFLEEIMNIDVSIPDNGEKAYEIMTYHAAKGLEFDAVFLPEVVEGHVPGRGGILQAGIEEERRLFYVAMTRAKQKLYIYAANDPVNHSIMPSRFIKELEEYSKKDPSE